MEAEEEQKTNINPGARADSSGQSMIIHGLDLNYLGVSNVWNNDFGMFIWASCNKWEKKLC